MMRRVLRWSLLLFIFVSLPIMACGLFTGDSSPPPVDEGSCDTTDSADELAATAAPAETAETGDVNGTAGDGPPFPGIGALNESLSQFDSYRSVIAIQFESSADATQSGSVTMETSHVNEPPASSMEMAMSGKFAEDMEALGEGVSVLFVEVGGASYSVLPGLGCITGAAGQDVVDEFDDVLDSDDMLGDIQDPEYVGEEVVNGVSTHHYRFDERNVTQSDEQFEQVQGDIYISQERNYVVRLTFEGVGELDMFDTGNGEGTVQFAYDVLDVDQAIPIDPPAECLEAASDFPVMEGAGELTTIAGLTTYSVNASLDDVINFYQEEMAARGYTVDEEPISLGGSAILRYVSDEMPDVTVTLGADGDTVSVLIMAEDS